MLADLGNDLDGIFPLPEPLEYQGAIPLR